MFKLLSCQKYHRIEILDDDSCCEMNLIGDISYLSFNEATKIWFLELTQMNVRRHFISEH